MITPWCVAVKLHWKGMHVKSSQNDLKPKTSPFVNYKCNAAKDAKCPSRFNHLNFRHDSSKVSVFRLQSIHSNMPFSILLAPLEKFDASPIQEPGYMKIHLPWIFNLKMPSS